MALNVTELARVLEEIAPALHGGWIQKIQQPTDRMLVFEIRVPGQTHRLLVSCQPESARIHLATRLLPSPPTPPPFCQFLRAHLQGARINHMRQVPDDRVVEIRLTTKDGPRAVLCELTGKTATVLVLDAEGRILRELNNRRDRGGHTYDPPAHREAGSHKNREARFSGARGGADFPISAAIESHYQDKEAALAVGAEKDARLRALRKILKKEQRRIEGWQGDLAKADQYRDYARYGELLKANLGSIKKGTDRITLIDYFDDAMPEMTIPLDAAKSAQGNMDDYFRKYRKYLTAERELKPRIEQAERQLDKVRREIKTIEEGTWTAPDQVPSHRTPRAATHTATRNDKHSTAPRRSPFRRFLSTDGLPIFVGRNARENDGLTFGLAKSDDLWLHARGTPGSHVVVRLEKGKDPPTETLKDAAILALLYSDLKKSGKGEVIYTRRKWVKKAKGHAPGAVIITQDKSLHVSLDKKRLDALKARSDHE